MSHSPTNPCDSVHLLLTEKIDPTDPREISTRPAASVPGLALEGLLGAGRLLGKLHESHFGSVFLRVVDELTIIPITGSDVSALNGNSAGPGSATSCRWIDKSVYHFCLRLNIAPAAERYAYLDDLR